MRGSAANKLLIPLPITHYVAQVLIPLSLGDPNSIHNLWPIHQSITLELVCERCAREETPQARMRRPIAGRNAGIDKYRVGEKTSAALAQQVCRSVLGANRPNQNLCESASQGRCQVSGGVRGHRAGHIGNEFPAGLA
jgi:hypothetical protein